MLAVSQMILTIQIWKNNYISTELNGFKYCYEIQIIMFNIDHMFLLC